MPIEDTEIIRRIDRAIDAFLFLNPDLLTLDASERSITHKLAEHIQLNFRDWNVDCEYNRHGISPKTLENLYEESTADEPHAYTVFPDIIVHHRGIPDDNLVVIEVKKSSNPQSHEKDKRKLICFTGEQYGYQLGLFLLFDIDENDVGEKQWYSEGHVKILGAGHGR